MDSQVRKNGTKEKPRILMVGGFPPPVRGMPVINAAVRNEFEKAGITPAVIELSALNLTRSLPARLGRLPKVLRGLSRFALMRGLHGTIFYISISGGMGQFYETLFVILARLHGMRLYLHHHSFAYLTKPTFYTTVLTKTAGVSAVHITQSFVMAAKLRATYTLKYLRPISNTVFLTNNETYPNQIRTRLITIGFISNISREKGVFEFLDLVAVAEKDNIPMKAKLAGPFQDSRVENLVRSRLAQLRHIDYVGPKYGVDKDIFFENIDVLIFPTRYANEAEPIVTHEAMRSGVPIIAYGRGCIPEIIGKDCGEFIDPHEPFVPAALEKIKKWTDDPASFAAASKAAMDMFADTFHQNKKRWQELLSELAA
jgi:glycosyltransferase involved in cell wall biosynthesis